MICTTCGQHNPNGVPFCRSCKSTLSLAAEETGEPQPHELVERYAQFEDAASKTLSGEWTDEQLGVFLDQVAEMLAQKEAEIRDIAIPQEAFDEFRQELEVGFSGVQMYKNGIDILRRFLEDGDAAHIHEGLEHVRQGNVALNEAMKINRENRQRLEQLFLNGTATL